MSFPQFQIEVTYALLVLDDWVLGRVNNHPSSPGTEESSQNIDLSVLKTRKSWAHREELV